MTHDDVRAAATAAQKVYGNPGAFISVQADQILALLDELEITSERIAAALRTVWPGAYLESAYRRDADEDAAALLAALRAPEPKEGV